VTTPLHRPDLDVLGRALGRRACDIAAAVRRLDGLVPGGSGPDASRPGREDLRELVLRTLRLAGEPGNDRILRTVGDAGGTAPASELGTAIGRPRLALWEAVGDLVQVGLLEREPARDGVALTAAGVALLALVDTLVEAGEQL
jgi:hypothetical protein